MNKVRPQGLKRKSTESRFSNVYALVWLSAGVLVKRGAWQVTRTEFDRLWT